MRVGGRLLPAGLLWVVLQAFLLLIPSITAVHAADLAGFHLYPIRESLLLAGGLTLDEGGNKLVSDVTIPDLTTLHKRDIPGFDRFAAGYYSNRLAKISDYTLSAVSGLVVLESVSLLSPFKRQNFQAVATDLVMFLECGLLTNGLTNCAKGLTGRPRPYAYNTGLSDEMRSDKGAYVSFWSGHTSHAFATAVFAGYVFQKRHPGSRFTPYIWISGLSLASATATLRVRSGKHFPSDVLAGAAAGSLVGWLVPWMHRNRTHTSRLSWNAGLSNTLSLRYDFR